MYRDKSKPPKTPYETKFWNCAAKLKKDGYKTVVHALAWESPKAYYYLLSRLQDKTPLERITILLWRDYYPVVKKLEMSGYGTLSPSSLRTFREKYFKTKNLPNPQQEELKVEQEISYLQAKKQQIMSLLNQIMPIEERVALTNVGENMRLEVFDAISEMTRLQTRLRKRVG